MAPTSDNHSAFWGRSFLSKAQSALITAGPDCLEICRQEAMDALAAPDLYSGKFAEPRLSQIEDRLCIAKADLRTLLDLNRRLRCAYDFKLIIDSFTCRHQSDLKKQMQKNKELWHWALLSNHKMISVKVTGSTGVHEKILKELLRDAAKSAIAECGSMDTREQSLELKVHDHRAQLLLSFRGAHPWQRGFLSATQSSASMRGHTVASLQRWALQQAKVKLSNAVLDSCTYFNPFCGSGIFTFEWIATQRALPLEGDFAWKLWPWLPVQTIKHFGHLKYRSTGTLEQSTLWDITSRQITAAQRNAEEFCKIYQQPLKTIRVDQKDFFSTWTTLGAEAHNSPWILFANPPYGLRLSDRQQALRDFQMAFDLVTNAHHKNPQSLSFWVIPEVFINQINWSQSPEKLWIQTLPFRSGGLKLCYLGLGTQDASH